MRRSALVAAITAAATFATPTSAADAPPHRLEWKEGWRRFEVLDYGVTGTLVVELALLEFVARVPEEPNWRGPILFDRWARDTFALRSPAGRDLAIRFSDPLTIGLQAYPVLDGIVVPLFFDDFNVDLFWQITMMNAQAILAAGTLNRIAISTVGRERPDAPPCREDAEYSKDCNPVSNQSFFSGHASGAFAGAALSCAHHSFVPLYGSGGWDRLACVAPVALATIDGLLRFVADRHYLTDVLTGGAVGAAVGFGVPLLHYGFQSDDDRAAAMPVSVVPVLSSDAVGLALGGVL